MKKKSNLIASIITIVTIAAAVITIYQFFKNDIKLTIIFIELLALIILTIYCIKFRNLSCINPILHQCQSMDSVYRDLTLARSDLSALAVMMNPSAANTDFELELFEKNAEVIGANPMIYMHMKGRNVSGSPKDSLLFRISADARVDAEKIRLRYGYQNFSGKMISYRSKNYDFSDNSMSSLIEIPFESIVGPGEMFEIWFIYEWPGSLTLKRDYVFYPCGFFINGVHKLKSKIKFDQEILYAHVFEVPLDSSSDPIPLDRAKCVLNKDHKGWNLEHTDARGYYAVFFERR